jgi:hypothetical protein
MIRLALLALALVIATPGLPPPPAEAQTQKKAEKKKAEKKKAKSPGKGRAGYTAEERKRIQEYARKVCRQEFGASSTVYRIDYKKLRVICNPPGS